MKKPSLYISTLLVSVLICAAAFAAGPVQYNTFVVYGDSQRNHDTHRAIMKLIARERPAAIFHTGDMVDRADSKIDWANFEEIAAQMRKTSEFYPAMGNHEKGSKIYFKVFPALQNRKWYSVQKGKIHFIILDSFSKLAPGSEQYNWLESDLKNIGKNTRFTIAVLHRPIYSTGFHSDSENLIRDIVPLFERYNVDMVFSGHDHHYERSHKSGIYYIVSGGGGARLWGQVRESPLSQVFKKVNHFCVLTLAGDELKMRVLDIDSNVIDRVSIKAKR